MSALPSADAFVKTFRTVFKFMVPSWLQTGQGEVVQWLEGLMIDAFLEACQQTAYLMLPSKAASDALPRIGADRGIPQGFFEPDASYRRRLAAWRYPRGHRIRGNALGLLEQLAAAFGATEDVLQTIDARGTRYTWTADGTSGAERGVSWNWDGEALTPNWARFWIYVHPLGAAPWPSFTDGAWGPTVANPDACVGMSGVHPGLMAAVLQLVKVQRLSWTPAGRRPIYMVVDISGTGFPVPDGTWDSWATRSSAYRYEPLHASIA